MSASSLWTYDEQLLTHHDRSKSVAVSAVVNNANTIQYIIHFTWTHTQTHRAEESENVTETTHESPQHSGCTCQDTWGTHANA